MSGDSERYEEWPAGLTPLDEARAALEKIAACETEHANATVKRMAKIAREALCTLSLVVSNCSVARDE